MLFFNGWGMDLNPLSGLALSSDLLLFYDYESIDSEINISQTVKDYAKVHLAAWSLGVWAAAEALAGKNIAFASSFAINGTLTPIDEELGIPPALYDATLASWSEESKERFYRRICGREGREAFLPPARTVDGQKRELAALKERITTQKATPENPFSCAAASTKDMIFPFEAQLRSWRAIGVEATRWETPHYPFYKFTSFEEALFRGRG